MKVVYRISEYDFVDARKLFMTHEKPWYRRLSRLPLPWIGVFVLVSQLIYLIVEPHRDIGFVIIGSIVGIYLLYCGFAPRMYFRRAYRKDHRFKHEFTADISGEGIYVLTPFSDSLMRWNSFTRFLESGDIFMLFISEWNFVVLPKRSFAADQIVEFRSLLQRNIALAA